MRMIFYHPVPIEQGTPLNRASKLRPVRMLAAFKKIGITVDEVCGYGKERKAAIDSIKENYKNGIKYDFAYGENTTLPFMLNEKNHIPKYPFLDYSFFAWLKRKNIPFGCFYRDIYWKFPEFKNFSSLGKWLIPLFFHYMDVYLLKKLSSRLFLPSYLMQNYLPFNFIKTTFDSLPPGCDLDENVDDCCISGKKREILNFFYVGGVAPPNYDITPMLSFFSKKREDISFTLACRKNEWEELSKTISKNKIDNINLLHKSSEELIPYWRKSSVFLALWGDVTYRNFAMPFKIIESIGYGLPIITSKKTAVGCFVEKNGFGWAIEPNPTALEQLVELIKSNPDILKEKKLNIIKERSKHTWEARAQKVVNIFI